MIHTKLLIRRLAYVPWLLAFGLVLGWAGEAAGAGGHTLTLSLRWVRPRILRGNQQVTIKADRHVKGADRWNKLQSQILRWPGRMWILLLADASLRTPADLNHLVTFLDNHCHDSKGRGKGRTDEFTIEIR